MRSIKLTGREVSIVRAIGFADPVAGSEILEFTRMEADDVASVLNGLMSAGFVESVPYFEEVQIEQLPGTSFEVNPAYVGEIRTAMLRR